MFTMLLMTASVYGYSIHPPTMIRAPRPRSISMAAALESSDLAASPQAAVMVPCIDETPESSIPLGSVDPVELTKQYDLVVVGGGPAGVAGALKAAQIGKRVLIVDKPKSAPSGGGLDFGFGGPTGLFSKALRDVGKSLDIDSMRAMGLDQDVIWNQVSSSSIRQSASQSVSHGM